MYNTITSLNSSATLSVSGVDKVGLLSSLDETYDISIEDSLLATYSFDNVLVPGENEHNPGTYDGTLTGTTQVPGVASDAKTKLLLHMEGITDSSFYNRTVANTGVTFTTSQSGAFGTNSASFNGSSYLEIADADGFSFGTENFTIELWVNTTFSGNQAIICKNVGAGWDTIEMHIYQHSTLGIVFQCSDSGSVGVSIYTSEQINDGNWHHIAGMRSGNMFYLLIDGIMKTSTSMSITLLSSSAPLWIGKGSAAANFTGEIDEVRITKGSVVYSPTGSTSMLLRASKVNGSTDFTDADVSDWNHTVTAYGSTNHSGTVYKAGMASSFAFNGSTDYLELPAGSPWNFGADDFTIEAWFYSTSSAWQAIAAQADSAGGTNDSFMIRKAADGRILAQIASVAGVHGNISLYSITVISNNEWTHLACVRHSDEFAIYINGVKDATAVLDYTMFSSTRTLRIGANHNASPHYFNGYLDEVTITKGRALYTEDFQITTTPALPLQDYTVPTEAFTAVESEFGLARSFNGSSDVITADLLPLEGDTEFSFSTWLKINVIPGGSMHMLSNGTVSGGNYNFLFAYYPGGGTGISTIVYNSTNGTAGSYYHPAAGEWIHVGLVYKDETQYLYINGELLATDGSGTGALKAATGSLNIGKGSSYLNGDLDDVRFFDRALTAEEVNSLFKPGIRYFQEALPATLQYDFGSPINDPETLPALHYTMDLKEATPHTVINYIEETRGLTTLGASGANFPTTTTGVEGVEDDALAFNGSSQYIDLPHLDNVYTSAQSVSFWAKKTDLSRGTVFIQPQVAGGWLFIFNLNNSQVKVARNDGTSNWYCIDASSWETLSATMDAGEWHHYAIAWGSSSLDIYVDGVLEKSGAIPTVAGGGFGDASSFWIGDAPSDGYFNGSIDDFRLFSSKLTLAEVTSLYNSGTSPGDATTPGTGLLQDQLGGNHGQLKGGVKQFQPYTFYDIGVLNTTHDPMFVALDGPQTWAFEILFLEYPEWGYPMTSHDSELSDSGLSVLLGQEGGGDTLGIRGFITNTDDVTRSRKCYVTSPLNTWITFVLVYDGTDIEAYANGSASTAVTDSASFEHAVITPEKFEIGANNGNALKPYYRNIEIYSGAATNPADWIPAGNNLNGVTPVLFLPTGGPE